MLADNERDEVRAADNLIEYMESMGLDDPKNWESFAENWRDGNGLGWLGELAIKAADAFDIPIEELEPAVDQVSARSGTKGKTGSVKPLDVGTYSDLKKHERVGDDLEHDHIPSSAALKKAKEKQLGRKLTAQEKKEIHDQGTAIEVPKEVHAKGDTWRHKNTQARIESEASNLSAAARRDYNTTRKNLIAYGYSAKEVDEALDKMRHANRRKGI